MTERSAFDEKVATDYLSSKGFEVSKIAESGDETCDLLAVRDSESYLIEVKSKELSEEEDEGLQTQEVYQHPSKTLGYTHSINRVIHKASKQLEKSARHHPTDFRLVWYSVIDSFDPYPNYERVLSTLYGMTRIVYNQGLSKGCYYFKESSFFRHRGITGAIIVWNDKNEFHLELLLNDFSKSLLAFKNSELFKVFASTGAYRLPSESSDESYFIADFEEDRRNTPAMIRGVLKKYGLRNAINFDFDSHDATITIPTGRTNK
jgi:hypothetical protein